MISSNFRDNNDKINQVFSNLEAVSDKAAKADFTETINKANLAIADFQLLIDGINKGNGSIGKLLNDDELYSNLEDASKSLDNLISDMKENPSRYVHFSIFGKRN